MAQEPIFTKGKDVLVYIDGVAVGCDKSCTLELTTDTFDTTTKCSTGANGQLVKTMIPVINNYKVTGNGLQVLDIAQSGAHGGQNEYSGTALIDILLDQIKVYLTWVEITQGTNGPITNQYGFDAYCTKLSKTASTQEVETYDYEFVAAGPMSKSPVS